MGARLTAYWLWRKAYLRVQNQVPLSDKGKAEISRWQNSIAKLLA
jgi:hypothetical protein